jgi:hypothetical protein
LALIAITDAIITPVAVLRRFVAAGEIVPTSEPLTYGGLTPIIVLFKIP